MSEPLSHHRTGDAEPGETPPAARRSRQPPTRRSHRGGGLRVSAPRPRRWRWRPERSVAGGMVCGALIAEASLIAFWAVFGPGNLVVRLPAAFLAAMTMCYVLVLGNSSVVFSVCRADIALCGSLLAVAAIAADALLDCQAGLSLAVDPRGGRSGPAALRALAVPHPPPPDSDVPRGGRLVSAALAARTGIHGHFIPATCRRSQWQRSLPPAPSAICLSRFPASGARWRGQSTPAPLSRGAFGVLRSLDGPGTPAYPGDFWCVVVRRARGIRVSPDHEHQPGRHGLRYAVDLPRNRLPLRASPRAGAGLPDAPVDGRPPGR